MKGIYILYSLRGGYRHRLLKGAEETRYKVKNTWVVLAGLNSLLSPGLRESDQGISVDPMMRLVFFFCVRLESA